MTWSADDLKRMEERGRRFRQDHSGDDRDEFKDNDQINTIPDGWGAEHTEYDIESDGDDWGDIEEEERYDIEEEISNSTANTPSDSSFHSLSETQLRELVKEVLREMRTPTPGQQAKAFLEDKGISCLHYIAPLGTSILIAKDGVVSYNRRKQLESSGTLDQRWLHSLGVDSLADPNVQSRRHNKVFSDGRSIHDFVPLYFATHTPMQYVKIKEAP